MILFETKKATKKTLISIGLVVGYSFYSHLGTNHSDKAISKLRTVAMQKADTNHDEKLDLEELFAAYKRIGLSGEELVKKIDFSGFSFPNNFAKSQDNFNEYVRALVDTNHDGKIDYDEAKQTFKTIYWTGTFDSYFLSCRNGSIFGSIFRSLFLPFTYYKGSELERYVMGEK